jgi:hypothetical protein
MREKDEMAKIWNKDAQVSRRRRARLLTLRTYCKIREPIRVARFFFGHDTKTGKNVPNEHKMYIPNGT